MRATVIHALGEPEVLVVEERPEPVMRCGCAHHKWKPGDEVFAAPHWNGSPTRIGRWSPDTRLERSRSL